jgi:predicted nucleotidyltransferase
MNGLTDNELSAIRALKETLTRDFGLVELKLIGSKARGDSSQESDIDVVAVVRRHDWRTDLEIYDLCFEISLEYDVLFQPIIYSEEEFHNKRTSVTPFYRTIVREGIPL